MDAADLARFAEMLGLLREHGVTLTKYQTPEFSIEAEATRSFFKDAVPAIAGAPIGAEVTDDFDPGKAYQDAIEKTAEAIQAARAKEPA